jgi:methylphosphotriester-DNA--protein-cysteine methyltransferase
MTSPSEDFQERKIYFLARKLWPMREELAPSGAHWRSVFKRHAGMSIEEYAKYAKTNNLRDKYERPD